MKSYILYSAINNILSGLYRTCKLCWGIVLRNKLDPTLENLDIWTPSASLSWSNADVEIPPPPTPVNVFLSFCQKVEYEKNYIPLTSFKFVYICFKLNQIHAKNTGSKGPKRPQKAPFSRALFGFFICVGPFGALAPPIYHLIKLWKSILGDSLLLTIWSDSGNQSWGIVCYWPSDQTLEINPGG